MAKGARRLQRTQTRQTEGGKAKKKQMRAPMVQRVEQPDPLSALNIKQLAFRLGLVLAAVWLIGAFVASIAVSSTVKTVALSIPGAVTVAVVLLVLFTLRQARKVKGVAGILNQAETADDRKAAIEQIDASYKKKDPTAIFAKAQLLLQEDPQKALEVLEQIDLGKVMAPVADQARGQRAMIHLMLGQVSEARDLVDSIELSRHQDAKMRAMLGAVVAEAWARSGQSKKAVETVELFNPEDEEYEALRPQLYRARAFACAYSSDVKGMRRALRKLADQDVRHVAGFMIKKTHPLLQKEAKKLLEQSGQVPRKMVIQRRP